jgi:hypothetical protein
MKGQLKHKKPTLDNLIYTGGNGLKRWGKVQGVKRNNLCIKVPAYPLSFRMKKIKTVQSNPKKTRSILVNTV